MFLTDTAQMMSSADYKERFKAEYYQLKIRTEKLYKILVQQEAGTLRFKLACPHYILNEQLDLMKRYLHTLEVRAEIEEIEL